MVLDYLTNKGQTQAAPLIFLPDFPVCLLELAEDAFSKDEKLSDIKGYVEDSGEGRWTVQQALETGVPAQVITLSLLRRFRSRQDNPFSDRVLAALRREFGGHAVIPTNKQG